MSHSVKSIGGEQRGAISRDRLEGVKEKPATKLFEVVADRRQDSLPAFLQGSGVFRNSGKVLQQHGFKVAAAYYPKADLVLPEPRYVQTGVDVEEVEGKRYEIPVVKDQWDVLLNEKMQQLKLGSVDDEKCQVTSWINGVEGRAPGAGIACPWRSSYCIREESVIVTVPTLGIDHHTRKTECAEYGTDSGTDEIDFADMANIRKDHGFLEKDNKVLFELGDKKKELEFSNTGEAITAAKLLEELRFIRLVMKNDQRNNPYQADIDRYEKAKGEVQDREFARQRVKETLQKMEEDIQKLSPEEGKKLRDTLEALKKKEAEKGESDWVMLYK